MPMETESMNANEIERRLDALIRMTIEILTNENKKMETGEIIRALRSAGLIRQKLERLWERKERMLAVSSTGQNQRRIGSV